MRKYLSILVTTCIILIIILCSPIFSINTNQPDYFPGSFVSAKVTDVLSEQLEPHPTLSDRFLGTQEISVKILSGNYTGQSFDVINPLSSEHYVFAKKGMNIIINMTVKDNIPTPWVYSYKDDSVILFLLVAFIVLMVILGGLKGLKSILSLIFTGVLIVFILLPLIFQGYNSAPIAILIASLSTIVTFLLIGGYSFKTLSSILGTILGIIIAGCISWGAGKLAHLSGITMENSEQLLFIARDYQIQIKGLMFTSILICSLGAIMDVAMSLASSIFEMYELNPKIPRTTLLRSAMNIGKDMMGTMSNTLILTFVGGSLNIMLLIWGYQMGYNQFINIPLIKTEIIQGLSGSIGIILTVPITAVLSVYFTTYLGKKNGRKKK